MALADFFRRRPTDLGLRVATGLERERQEVAGRQTRRLEQEHKYAARGLDRAADELGLENARPLSSRSLDDLRGQAALEGEVMVDGHSSTIVLTAAAYIFEYKAGGLLGGVAEERNVHVDVLHEGRKLGTVSYRWDSSQLGRRPSKTSYSLPAAEDSIHALSGISQVSFLALVREGITAPQVAIEERPELSALSESQRSSASAGDGLSIDR